MPNSNYRIFWLGMHEVLVRTELPRLRMLGFEVFNPPYISPVRDQSANLDWNSKQPTTLPADVFDKLARYDFFYNEISADIAALLNEHFDAVIVTISPTWLVEFAKAYKGKLIYRVYGQIGVLTEYLYHNGLLSLLDKRDNFWFVPHAAEALHREHSWLRERMAIVPYSLPDDIFEHQDTWVGGNREVALSCPNIDNHFYKAHFEFLKRNFSEEHFRYYGKQLSEIPDPNVVGTLQRREFIERFRRASGYLYTYSDARVCYLPPIEMMVLGGPVLFLRGSLLDRYMPDGAPGRCDSVEHAKALVQRLLDSDRGLVNEIVNSQADLRKRYSPDHVWPIFDATFRRILSEGNSAPRWLIDGTSEASTVRRVYVMHHFPGHPVVFDGDGYTAYDGIPRVVRLVVQALASNPGIEVVVTAHAYQVEAISAYFRGERFAKNVRVLCVDPGHLPKLARATGRQRTKRPLIQRMLRKSAKLGRKAAKRSFRALFPKLVRGVLRRSARRCAGYLVEFFACIRGPVRDPSVGARVPSHIETINADSTCAAVLVPHYYWFPEALSLRQKVVMYLPDYMPHFFHETGEFRSDEGRHTEIGRLLAQKSDGIFCNSKFTRSYLPSSRLQVPDSKIRVFYLPLLNAADQSGQVVNGLPLTGLPSRYVFYPTQPRANKNLALLIRVFDRLADMHPDLGLCLTSRLDPDPRALDAYQHMRHRDRVFLHEHVSDAQLRSFYAGAALLCFTSLAEGNFPPQIHEALIYRVPVVAGRHLFITERFPIEGPEPLLLCEPNNEEEFVAACKFALDNRDVVLGRQAALLEQFDNQSLQESFHREIVKLFGVDEGRPGYEEAQAT